MNIKPIIKRPAYSFAGSARIYRTSYSCANAMAWKIIAERHGSILSPGTINHLWYSCECDLDRYDKYYSNGCPLHDKKIGYFKRLSIKLIKIILEMYASEWCKP